VEVSKLGLVDTSSLAETIDRIEEAFFFSRLPAAVELTEAIKWIAFTQGKPASYAGMFSPTKDDVKKGARVFTGEAIRSRAALRHILGEEACRILIRSKVTDPLVKESLELATAGMLARLQAYEGGTGVSGIYCCGFCSVAYWRHVAAGGLDKNEARLTAGIAALNSLRAGKGKWRRFPFYYTLLALNEIDMKPAQEEMRYAALAMENYLKRVKVTDKYAGRRRRLFENILTKI